MMFIGFFSLHLMLSFTDPSYKSLKFINSYVNSPIFIFVIYYVSSHHVTSYFWVIKSDLSSLSTFIFFLNSPNFPLSYRFLFVLFTKPLNLPIIINLNWSDYHNLSN